MDIILTDYMVGNKREISMLFLTNLYALKIVVCFRASIDNLG